MSCSARHLRACVVCCASSQRTTVRRARGRVREQTQARRQDSRRDARALRDAAAGDAWELPNGERAPGVRRRGRSFGSYSAATGDRPQSSCLPPSPSPSTPPRPLLVPLPPHAGRLASTTASQHGGKPSTSQTRAPLKTSQRRRRVRVLVDVPTGTAHPSPQTRY